MTVQRSDRLIYLGETVSLWSQPLDVYFKLARIVPRFAIHRTDNWRGYIATWEIIGERLYLKYINAETEDGTKVTLATFFPTSLERVFADWFSGSLYVPRGDVLESGHFIMYGAVYERELVIKIKKGRVTKTLERRSPDAIFRGRPGMRSVLQYITRGLVNLLR